MKRGFELRALILTSLIAGAEVATTRLLPWLVYYLPSPATPIVRVSLQFLWYGMAGWLLGPGWAMGGAMAGDLIGAMLNPTGSGTFFPGFTLTAAASGLLFGFMLHKRKPAWWLALVTVGLYQLAVALPLTALWSSHIGGPEFMPAVWTALPWRAMLILPYTLVLYAVQKALERPLAKYV